MSLPTLSPRLKNLEKILAHSQRRRYSARSSVICLGDDSDTLYLLIKGTLSILIEDTTGKELIVTYLQPGDFFGEMGLFDTDAKKQKRSALVVARTDCEVATISYDKFRQLVEKDIDLLYELMRQMTERLRQTTYKAHGLCFLDITGRVAATLQDLCKQPGAMTHSHGTQIRITRQEIARINGCSREMVGRVLKKLEEQGVIQVNGRTIVVFDNMNDCFADSVPLPKQKMA